MLPMLLATIENDVDRALFAEIYEQYHERMEQAALRILKDTHDAEDAVQNAFLKIIRPIENASSLHSVKVATPLHRLCGYYLWTCHP